MPITCEINFENNPQKVIYSGQMMLRGSVQLNLSAEKNVRGVYIELFGGECASWTSGIGRYQKSYIAEELYLNKRIYFVSGGSGDARLAAGIHNYSFECDLPTSLPTTMESENGYIRYVARVVFDIPLWPSKIITQPFTVIKPVDLNTVPTLRYPITFEKTDTITGIDWLCWLYADPMKISVRIPLSGYVPGQTIKVQINVSNQTGQPISGIMVKLIRRTR
ncbi:arrestin domain-containing protein 17-like [Sitodiplosis mosellana]|uniref:arrestin domain-containing protein 17-like n=1 Tax=Sitodiplosis mosellana TaxID=263140 RepID=UPI002444FCC7|nr:arrestin domain-containing protein 17-like [Sitodiplosis mosellana]